MIKQIDAEADNFLVKRTLGYIILIGFLNANFYTFKACLGLWHKPMTRVFEEILYGWPYY